MEIFNLQFEFLLMLIINLALLLTKLKIVNSVSLLLDFISLFSKLNTLIKIYSVL